jgi:hypothetical protein
MFWGLRRPAEPALSRLGASHGSRFAPACSALVAVTATKKARQSCEATFNRLEDLMTGLRTRLRTVVN